MKKILALMMACGLISQSLANTQSETLTQEQLVEVLVDLELAKAMVYSSENNNLVKENTLFQDQVQLIYETYAIDSAIFQKSYVNYLNDPIRLQALYDQIINRLEELLGEN